MESPDKIVPVLGVGVTEDKVQNITFHFKFDCPRCGKSQYIHTFLASRYGDLGNYTCQHCGCSFHCTTDDNIGPDPIISVYDNGHCVSELHLPKDQRPKIEAPEAQDKSIPEGAYTPDKFHTTQLLNDGIYIMLGYFDTRKGRIFSIGYDFPDHNEDYFEYVRISENEWRRFKELSTTNMTKEEANEWYQANIKGRQLLCNEFSSNPAIYKPYFTDKEITVIS